jgi:ABC-type phosphate/phosphonate transport system permease subunit
MTGADVHWAAIVGTLASILAAVGTLAAVIVALYLQYWQDRRTRPSLSLRGLFRRPGRTVGR